MFTIGALSIIFICALLAIWLVWEYWP